MFIIDNKFALIVEVGVDGQFHESGQLFHKHGLALENCSPATFVSEILIANERIDGVYVIDEFCIIEVANTFCEIFNLVAFRHDCLTFMTKKFAITYWLLCRKAFGVDW